VVIKIFNWNNFIDKVYRWVHENQNDIEQIKNRSMLVSASPIFIGFLIGIIIAIIVILISEVGGQL
jgi:hypothetical protein